MPPSTAPCPSPMAASNSNGRMSQRASSACAGWRPAARRLESPREGVLAGGLSNNWLTSKKATRVLTGGRADSSVKFLSGDAGRSIIDGLTGRLRTLRSPPRLGRRRTAKCCGKESGRARTLLGDRKAGALYTRPLVRGQRRARTAIKRGSARECSREWDAVTECFGCSCGSRGNSRPAHNCRRRSRPLLQQTDVDAGRVLPR